MSLPLNIAITADPELPVPPLNYGGIERMVAMLVEGLLAEGHRVTLFAHPDSKTGARLQPWPGIASRSPRDTLANMVTLAAGAFRDRYDIIHSFGRLVYLAPLLPLKIPKLMSYQRAISARSVMLGEIFSRGTLHFAACGAHMMRQYAERPHWHVVHNAASMSLYTPRTQVAQDAPLVFLGRIQEEKGPHLAIAVARLAGRRLVIAGNVPAEHAAFFESEIRPHLEEGKVEYIGPVNDEQKNELLGNAWAFLMPILWEEPFGIVMAEALACGAPIIGLNRASVPEVVQNGVNGFVGNSVEEMAAAVPRIKEIDRAQCRRIMEEQFSDQSLTQSYLRIYRSMMDESR